MDLIQRPNQTSQQAQYDNQQQQARSVLLPAKTVLPRKGSVLLRKPRSKLKSKPMLNLELLGLVLRLPRRVAVALRRIQTLQRLPMAPEIPPESLPHQALLKHQVPLAQPRHLSCLQLPVPPIPSRASVRLSQGPSSKAVGSPPAWPKRRRQIAPC